MLWRGLDDRLVPYAEEAMRRAASYNVHPVITSTRRTWGQQERLYANYLRGLSKYPANPPGQSAHQYGVAFDSVVPDPEWPLWNAIRASLGWKLYANDPVHAELPNWQSIATELRLT